MYGNGANQQYGQNMYGNGSSQQDGQNMYGNGANQQYGQNLSLIHIYKYYTHGNYWTNPVNYDLTLNSERVGVENCVKTIEQYLIIKGFQMCIRERTTSECFLAISNGSADVCVIDVPTAESAALTNDDLRCV